MTPPPPPDPEAAALTIPTHWRGSEPTRRNPPRHDGRPLQNATRDLWMLRRDRLGWRVAQLARPFGRFRGTPRDCPVRAGRLRWYWLVGWKAGRDEKGDKRFEGMAAYLDGEIEKLELPNA